MDKLSAMKMLRSFRVIILAATSIASAAMAAPGDDTLKITGCNRPIEVEASLVEGLGSLSCVDTQGRYTLVYGNQRLHDERRNWERLYDVYVILKNEPYSKELKKYPMSVVKRIPTNQPSLERLDESVATARLRTVDDRIQIVFFAPFPLGIFKLDLESDGEFKVSTIIDEKHPERAYAGGAYLPSQMGLLDNLIFDRSSGEAQVYSYVNGKKAVRIFQTQ